VSGDGASGAGAARLPISGPWSTIVINQTGSGNVLRTAAGGTITSKAGSTSASLTANYTTTAAGGNVHSLTIGKTTTPLNPSVVIFVKNNGASDNTVTDTLDGASLSYNLGLLGTGNAVTNTVSAATGGITLTQGNSAYGVAGGYGIAGDSNTVVRAKGRSTPSMWARPRTKGSSNHSNAATTPAHGPKRSEAKAKRARARSAHSIRGTRREATVTRCKVPALIWARTNRVLYERSLLVFQCPSPGTTGPTARTGRAASTLKSGGCSALSATSWCRIATNPADT